MPHGDQSPVSRRPLTSFALAGAAIIGLYFAIPAPVSHLAFPALGALTTAALVVGVRLNKPTAAGPWRLLTFAIGSTTVGATVMVAAELGGYELGSPSVADVPFLLGSAFIAVAALRFVQALHPRYRLTAATDAIIVGVAAALLLWQVVGQRIAENDGVAFAQRIVPLAYPVCDVLIFTAFAFMLLSGRPARLSSALLVTSLTALLVADVGNAIVVAASGVSPDWVYPLWSVSYVALGAAALHPSMRLLSEPVAESNGPERPARLVLLALSIFTLPAVALAESLGGESIDLYVLVPASGIVIVALLVRMNELVGIHRRVEQRQAALLTNASDSFSVLRPDSTIIYRSPAASRLTGYQDTESLGGSVLDITFPGDRPILASALARVAADPTATTKETFRVRFSDGSYHSIQATFANHMADPQIGGIVVNYRDVTAELEAAERVNFQARLLDEVQHAVVVTDAHGVVTYWNAAAERMYGWTAGEAVGRPLASLTAATANGRRALITQQIQSGGRWAGELTLRRKDGTRLTAMVTDSAIEAADGSITAIIGVGVDITERKTLEDQLRRQAFTDSLTGLANRTLFLDRVGNALSRARRNSHGLAVMFLDVDDFKTINDSLGHSAGDELLSAMGRRLAAIMRPGDTIARLGGDEFGVLLEGADASAAGLAATRVLDDLGRPFEIGGQQVFATASLGICVPSGRRDDAEDVLRNADIAMYQAKHSGRGQWAVFRPTMHEATLRRHRLMADLARAVELGELSLDYQAIVRMADSGIVGAEALLRWTHPTYGLVPATEVVSLAEETGEILRLGQWVVRTALAESHDWSLAKARTDDVFRIHINASVIELSSQPYPDRLAAAIAAAHANPSSVVIEITEGALISEGDAAVPVLQRLRSLGVRIAIDDFGTGYSSLKYLAQLPIDTVKIDRSLITRRRARASEWAIARSVIELTQSLGLEAIAEGIEHADERAALERVGCVLGQGFLLGRPVSAAAMADLLRARPRRRRGPNHIRPAELPFASGFEGASAGLS